MPMYYDDPTADSVIEKLNAAAERAEKRRRADKALEKAIAFLQVNGYSVHGRFTMIDDEGNCYKQYI